LGCRNLDTIKNVSSRLCAVLGFQPPDSLSIEELEEALSDGVVMAMPTQVYADFEIVGQHQPAGNLSSQASLYR